MCDSENIIQTIFYKGHTNFFSPSNNIQFPQQEIQDKSSVDIELAVMANAPNPCALDSLENVLLVV